MKLTKRTTCSCGEACRCKNCTCSTHARCFDALGNETRLQLVFALRTGARTVSELVEHTGVEQSLVSHSLRTLQECGLVQSAAQGKHRQYTLTKTVQPLLSILDEHIRKHEVTSAKPCCCS